MGLSMGDNDLADAKISRVLLASDLTDAAEDDDEDDDEPDIDDEDEKEADKFTGANLSRP